MKRKLALLLAGAMTLSMLPMNMFASSSNYLTGLPSTTNNKTVFVEPGTLHSSLRGRTLEIAEQGNVEIVQEGGYLEIEPKSDIPAGSQITVRLENAKWFFRDDTATNNWGDGYVTKSALTWLGNPAITAAKSNDRKLGNTANVIGANTLGSGSFGLMKTYADNSGASTYTGGSSGTYTRLGTAGVVVGAAPAGAGTIYTMTVSVDDTAVNIYFPNRILSNSSLQEGTDFTGTAAPLGRFRIPIIARTTSDDDIKISITETSNSGISAGTWVMGASGSGTTRTYVNDPQTARDDFSIDMIVIKENRVSSMGNGTIEINAPAGFYFNSNMLTDIEVLAENFTYPGSLSKGTWDGVYPLTNTNHNLAGGSDYQIAFKVLSNGDIDYSAIQIRFNTLTSNKSDRVPGVIYLKDTNTTSGHLNCLRLYAEENAAFGDINMKIRNLSSSDVVTDQTFVGGIRRDWGIEFKTLNTVPTLVNGRYEDVDADNAYDDIHLAAKISFKELIPNAWSLGRETRFELPEGVKFRKVEITKADKLSPADKAELTAKAYLNTGKRDGKVTLNGNTLSLNNLAYAASTNDTRVVDKTTLEMNVWLSVESGFEGDITLTATGAAIGDELDPLVIAKAISPVQIKTSVTDVKIGFQYFPVADIEVTETEAGMLEKGKQVWLQVTDNISTDMYFTDGFKHEVTDGNLKIKNVNIGSGGRIALGTGASSNRINLGNGTITFDVDGASSKASTIKFSNLQLKIDRTVPETQVPYNVIAWGPGIAPNYDEFEYLSVPTSYRDNDLHNTKGISAPYVRVVTSASGTGGGVLSSVVKVTTGSATAYVNGEQVTIDPAPFIDSTGRTQVPVRALATILGVSQDEIIWSDLDRTVTIDIKGSTRTVQFSIGSDIYLLNGAQVRMDTSAQIVNGRTFVPFRALGEALGVKVGWDDSTRTATYNAE